MKVVPMQVVLMGSFALAMGLFIGTLIVHADDGEGQSASLSTPTGAAPPLLTTAAGAAPTLQQQSVTASSPLRGSLPQLPQLAQSSATCRWTYVAYHPSPVEAEWKANIAEIQNSVCVATNALRADTTKWLEYSVPPEVAPLMPDCKAVPAPAAPTPAPQPGADPALHHVLSSFEYRWTCVDANGVEVPSGVSASESTVFAPIEPLAGPLRDPRICKEERAYMLVRDYIVFDAWSSSFAMAPPAPAIGVSPTAIDAQSRRAFYFDVGASTWNEGGGGPSQPYFSSWIQRQCFEMSGIYAWEARDAAPKDVWSQLPGELKPVYHWYNVFAQTGVDDWDNPLVHLRKVARPEDYVLFKLDIDNNAVEESLVNQILSSPELLGLIDEFFWEHHVNFHPMTKQWSEYRNPKKMNDSLIMFAALRESGIRAHSWT
jgi:hypothetical protein